MKTILRLLLLGVATVVAQAQTPIGSSFAPPLGGMTIAVPTGQARHVSIPLLHSAVGSGAVRGRVDSVGTDFIDVPTAGWPASGFSSVSNPYFLRLISGGAAGRLFTVNPTANTATRIFLNNEGFDLATHGIGVGASGDVYELVLADTLLSLFGTTALQGGTGVATADNVQVWGGASWLVFYFNTTRGRWERDSDTAGSPSRDNFVLRPDRGIFINRRAATDLNFVVTGRVPEVAQRFHHLRPGFSSLSAGVPVDLTLGTLALQSTSVGWQSGSNFATATTNADLIQIWGGASFLTFYHDSVSGHWQRADESAQVNRDSFVVPAGRPLMIRRLTSDSTAAGNVVTLPKPYAIAR